MSRNKAHIDETPVVGTRYQSRLGDGTQTPWLDENETLQRQLATNRWKRWDGVEGTAHEHMDWIKAQAVSLLSDDRKGEFRKYGTTRNGECDYYIHDALTKQQGGYGLFRLEATVDMEPRDLVAACFDMQGLADTDQTVVLMKVLKTYFRNNKKGPFCAAVYWANDPGFPFYYRDGVDLSSYYKDDDGTVWQVAVSAKGDNFISMPYAIDATDCYWAYRLRSNGDGTTKATLLCQTVLNGWIPTFLSNYFICQVLSDYLITLTKEVNKKKQTGEHQKLLKQLALEDL